MQAQRDWIKFPLQQSFLSWGQTVETKSAHYFSSAPVAAPYKCTAPRARADVSRGASDSEPGLWSPVILKSCFQRWGVVSGVGTRTYRGPSTCDIRDIMHPCTMLWQAENAVWDTEERGPAWYEQWSLGRWRLELTNLWLLAKNAQV